MHFKVLALNSWGAISMTLLKTACRAKSVFHPLQNRIEGENVPLQQQKGQRHFVLCQKQKRTKNSGTWWREINGCHHRCDPNDWDPNLPNLKETMWCHSVTETRTEHVMAPSAKCHLVTPLLVPHLWTAVGSAGPSLQHSTKAEAWWWAEGPPACHLPASSAFRGSENHLLGRCY